VVVVGDGFEGWVVFGFFGRPFPCACAGTAMPRPTTTATTQRRRALFVT
jgi:hypothetical protein